MKNIIIFASGKGSNAANIIQYFKKNGKAQVALIVCNNPEAGVLNIADTYNIPSLVIDKEQLKETQFTEQIKAYDPALIVLAGFLLKIEATFVRTFAGKIVNIHPSLLPKYGGKGMYGQKVHQAVCAAREKSSGITIHYVNEHYDEGAPILQAFCTLAPEEKPEDLAAKISLLEKRYFPVTLEHLLDTQ
jgi:phosphoribosylglycinamide formyltransferase-1